jgi:hypothetical protein
MSPLVSPLVSPFPSPPSLILHHELPNLLSLTIGSAAMNCLGDSCDARSDGPSHAITQGPPDPLLLQGRANALLLILLGATPDPREDTTARGRAIALGHASAQGGESHATAGKSGRAIAPDPKEEGALHAMLHR